MSHHEEQGCGVIIGTYMDGTTPSIYLAEFNRSEGKLDIVQQWDGINKPSFLDLDPEKGIAYFIHVIPDKDGNEQGGIVSYRISHAPLNLTYLNEQPCLPATGCHITLDQSKQKLIVSSYHGGMIGMTPLEEDGRIGSTTELHQHTGSSLLPIQSQARAHSAVFDPTNQFVIVADLGMDQLVIYKHESDQNKLTLHKELKVTPGSGPRHATFHPALPYFYVINELNSTINTYAFDSSLGTLSEIQSISTLPSGYSDPNSCADIHISPDGLFLYGSNRGHDSIVVYQINPEDGKLLFVEHVPTGGQHPRNFTLSPDGAYLLVANMNSNHIVTFVRNSKTGKLLPNGQILKLDKPVCVRFI